MPKKTKKIHVQAIIGNLGLLMHVPGIMALFSMIIIVIFKEYYAFYPLLITAVIGIGLGQILYRLFFNPSVIHIWDAMITAAIGWLICSCIAMIPFHLIAHAHAQKFPEIATELTPIINSFFEAFSGFTSTGLSMVTKPRDLPYVLQWWRSFLEWVGGIGLIVFVISITHPNKEEYQLYYSESRQDLLKHDITRTSRLIWMIYVVFTLIAIGLLYLAGMTFWDAINHGLSGISTGGFSTANNNLQDFSVKVQMTAAFVMILGMMSFALYYRVLKEKKISLFWTDKQNRALLILLFLGCILLLLSNTWTLRYHRVSDSIFQWVSALGTCGFHSTDLTKWAPMAKLLLVIGMVIGGASGSTAGGIKIKRFISLFSGIALRIRSLLSKKGEKTLSTELDHYQEGKENVPEVELPISRKTERLYSASILFSLWIITLLMGWFIILKWIPKDQALDALFDVASALGNCGLSLGVTDPHLHAAPKTVLIILMWLGRLEIIPAVLLFSFPIMKFFHKKKK